MAEQYTGAGGYVAPGMPVWDDAPWAPLPVLSGDERAAVCVVGLGGAGLSCIEALMGTGHDVVGVDATDVGGGAAGRNGGFLLAGLAPFHHDAVEQYGRTRAAGLYRLTMTEQDRVYADMPDIARNTGSLRIAVSSDEEADCERQLAAMRMDGLPAEPYEGPEGRGLLIPTDGVFNPLARCRLLAQRVLLAGARLYCRSPVRSVAPREVRTGAGRVLCDAVVVAVDGRLELLLPELAGEVRTARLQMLATAPVGRRLSGRPVYARYGYDYWQQLPDGRMAIGGYRDTGGEGEWTHAAEPDDKVQSRIEGYLRDALGVEAPVTHRWAASVSYTTSGLPVARQVQDGVWAVGGYSGTGNVLSTLLGRAMARAATGEKPADGDALLIGG